MSFLDNILTNLPEVEGPTQRKLSFKEKLKWTSIILVIFFAMGMFPLFGLGENELQYFKLLSTILGASFGSIISLGIGPIVTGSIVLQLLNGSKIVKFDLTTPEGKKRFQGVQKLLSAFFVIFEAAIYVLMGGLKPEVGISPLVLIFQLTLGGLLIMFMDEVVSKWGFGSGISLFIAAGVAQEIFIQAFSPLKVVQQGVATEGFVGKVPEIFRTIASEPTIAGLALASILATCLVFVIAVYAQAMKIEIPLSFGRVSGYGIRWPLSFIYTSNIPVILVAALMANMQLWGKLLQTWGMPLLGKFSEVTGSPESGLVFLLQSPNIVDKIIKGNLLGLDVMQALVYISFMIIGSVIFSWFWVQTAGMSAENVAKQILGSGLRIPGFRTDARVLERILERYITPLTIMGAIAVGFLAAAADLTGALSRGTGILLSVMIIYRLYEDIAKHHMMDMNPMMKKMMKI
jgi:preprotein translocase subunit SecY